MKNNFLEKIIDFIKIEKRIFLALFFLLLIFLINQALYSGRKKTANSCADGKCVSAIPAKSQLSQENNFYYINDLLKNQPAGFYRLTLQEKSNKDEKVLLKLSALSGKEVSIGELNFNLSDKFQNQEIVFSLPEEFDSLLFQKNNSAGDTDIFIKEVRITKLNINSQEELTALKKTIIGETEIDLKKENQSIADYSFLQLKEKKTVLGQIFQASDKYITGIALNIDINKSLNPGSRQYELVLRKVKYDKENISFDGSAIASLNFSVESIEKYRQKNGEFIFPLYGILEKDSYYFIGLDNSVVEVGNKNYLEIRGGNNNGNYPNGSAAIKKNENICAIDGDLYFNIYEAKFSEEAGVKILNGAKIEDLGKGLGKYSYKTKGEFIDLLDLETSSSGTEFNEDSKVIAAEAKNNASFSYAINTIYPINKMNFSATQVKAGWKKVKVSYSFDREVWFNMPFSENNKETIQIFDFDIIPTMQEIKTVYFKITYNSNDKTKTRYFALKNLRVTADLKIK